jgi:hypothetical protein
MMAMKPGRGLLMPKKREQHGMFDAPQETRQGLLGRTRGVIGGLLGSARDSMEANNPDATWADRLMILSGGLQQLGGTQGALMDATGFVDQRVQGRQQQQAMQQQQEQMAQFRASLAPEQQQLFDRDPEGFVTQMIEAEFRPPSFQAFGEDIFRTDRGLERVGEVSRGPTEAVRTLEALRDNPSLMAAEVQRRLASAPRTNINLPVPEREDIMSVDGDYATIRDPQSPAGVSRVLIPGSATDLRMQEQKADRTREEETEAERQARRQQDIARAGGTVIQDINRALEILDESERQGARSGPAAGPISGQFASVPGTPAFDIEQFVQSALSNVGLDTLQRMRENSPTGGALGQVPIQQQARLEQVLGSLKTTQRPEILRDNMNRVANIYMDLVFGTPQQLAGMLDRGEITQDQFDTYSQRAELSFDELGRRRERSRPDPLGLRGSN